MRQTTSILFLILAFLTAGACIAQDDPWAPPVPSADGKDWIHLSSGEWLGGTIKLMRDESLDFDSDELDDVTIDWVDIAGIRSDRMMTYVKRNGSMVTGTSTLVGDTIRIKNVAGEQEISRWQIQSILEGPPTELNFWSAKVGLEMKIRDGNTNQSDYGARVFLKREAAESRIDLRYQGNISQVDEIETIRNHRGNAEWKVFLSRKFFITPFNSEVFVDKFQNIDLRSTVGAGVGYYFSRNSKADWFLEVGGAYQETQYTSVEEGADGTDINPSIPVRTTLETDLTGTIELTAEYGVQIGLGSGANTIHHTFILFEFDLYGDMDFNASITWDHATRPRANAEGITPRKDDLAMAYGLSIDF